jgi:hypothetical protein
MHSYPKKGDQAKKHDEVAKGMFMANPVAALEHATIKTLDSTRLAAVQVGTLQLKT